MPKRYFLILLFTASLTCLLFNGSPAFSETPPYVEDHIYAGKTIHIEWYYDECPVDVRESFRTGLIDNGLLVDWREGIALPSESVMRMDYVGQGMNKYIFKVTFENEAPFAVGLKLAGVPKDIPFQFSEIMIPSYTYWKEKVSRGRLPSPEPGNYVVVGDKEVFTREYIDGIDRLEYMTLLRNKGKSDLEIVEICLREEAVSLWMIWKAANGVIVQDYKSLNILYTIDEFGKTRAKFFDFDLATNPGSSLKELFNNAYTSLKSRILTNISDSPPDVSNVPILLGFCDGMFLDGMSTFEIFVELDKLADVFPAEVAETKTIITSQENNPITWVEGLADETVEIKLYARPNIENALYDQGLLYNICLEGGIDIDAVSEVYGVFGMAGEYCYEYILLVKTAAGNFYYFDIDILKEGIDPAAYDAASVVNFRDSLHTQDPSVTGESLGLAATDTGKPVEAHQHHNFGYNLPPLSSIDLLIDQEVTDWFNEKYPDAAAADLGFFDALAIAGLSDIGAAWPTLEYLFGVPEDIVFNIASDVNVITGSYPDIFDTTFEVYLKQRKLTPFDAYTIWFENYNLGHPNTSLAKLYNIQVATVITITDKVTALYVPVDQIEQRLRTEWRQFFDEVKAVDEANFEDFTSYFKYIIAAVIVGTSYHIEISILLLQKYSFPAPISYFSGPKLI